MWLFRHVNVMSYKCSVMSTEVAPLLVHHNDVDKDLGLGERRAGVLARKRRDGQCRLCRPHIEVGSLYPLAWQSFNWLSTSLSLAIIFNILINGVTNIRVIFAVWTCRDVCQKLAGLRYEKSPVKSWRNKNGFDTKKSDNTRPNVNHAKDLLDKWFLFPCHL